MSGWACRIAALVGGGEPGVDVRYGEVSGRGSFSMRAQVR